MVTALRDQLQSTLGHAYQLDRELGGGGMSRVFVATETALGRQVVIKVLPPELAQGISVERFKREISLAAALQHAHIVPVHAAGETNGLPYFTMPFVDGHSLRARLAHGPLSVTDTISVLRDVAKALAYAHDHGVVHRDIKPDNVLLSGDSAVVTDFGVAKALSASRTLAPGGTLTQAGSSIGTPAYMAPEQAATDPDTDHRADIYSFGVMAYEMLAGRPPFHSLTPQKLLAAHMSEKPEAIDAVRPDVPPLLAHLVMQCLEKDPADRPQTAADVVRVLALPSDRLTDPRAMQDRTIHPPAKPETHTAQTNTRRRALIALAGGAATLLLVGGFWVANRRGSMGDSASVAVLPFVDMTPGKGMEYFGEGITEELIHALARVDGLRVPGRTSSFQFKERGADIKDVGSRLNVGTVVEGSIRRDGNNLRITAQLVNVADGYQMWSQTYNRQFRDAFTVQEEIARSIVGSLLPRLQGRSKARLVTGATADPEAHNLYLRGRYAWNKRTPEGLREAIRYFQEAVERDPQYALAYSGLADSYISLFDYELMPASEANPKARLAATRAMELDSTLAQPHNSLAHVLLHEWNWSGAEAEFRRALALDPSQAATYHWFALALTAIGKLDEAVEAMKRAEQLDPLSPRMSADLGMAYYAARQYDRAIEQELKTLRLEPNTATAHWIAGMAYEQKRMYPEATASLEAALKLRPGNANFLAQLARAHALAARPAEARKILDDLLRPKAQGSVSPFFVALVYTALDDKDRAFEWLAKSIEDRSGSVRYLKVEPRLDALRDDPRFDAMLKKIGLPR